MSVKMIQDRLDGYGCRSTLEEEQALREITQEITLAALGRTDFFQKAGFQGGTCLRVFHGLNRFSEDLDFALQKPAANFSLKPYLQSVAKELAAYGYGIEIDDRSNLEQAVHLAFVKDDSLGKLLQLNYKPESGPLRKLRIKFEVDTNPPAGAAFETKYLDFPFASAVCVFDLPSLFAGKLHALLCRQYLKGRDWYDFIWYTARRTPPNYALLSSALDQMGPWRTAGVQADRAWCLERLAAKIDTIDWKQAREDVRAFIKPNELPSLDLWTRDFFQSQAQKLA
jgi:predicted nucleotidyltransferase component of viral defense system